MANPAIQEVVGRVMVEKTGRTGAAETWATNVRKELQEKNPNWRGMLEVVREPVKQGVAAEHIQDIGVNYDADGKKVRTAEEQKRFDRASKGEAFSRRLLEKGYDSLEADEKEFLQVEVFRKAMGVSYLRNELSTMSDTQQKAWAEKYLRSEKFHQQLLKDRKSAEDMQIHITAEQLAEAEDKMLEAEGALEDKKADREDVDRMLKQTQSELKLFERDASGNPVGQYAKDIKDLRDNMTTYKGVFDAESASIKAEEKKLRAATQDRTLAYQTKDWTLVASKNAEIATIQGDIDDAQARAAEAKGKIDSLDALIARERQLHEEESRLEKSKKTADVQEKAEKTKYDRAKGKFESLKKNREAAEDEIADAFDGMVANAAGEVFNQEIKDVIEAYDKEIEKKKGETKDKTEAVMVAAIEKAWQGPEKRRKFLPFVGEGQPYHPINRRQVQEDYRVLINQGPEALERRVMQRMLPRTINPETGVNFSATEISGVLGNRELMNKLQPDLLKQLVGRRIITGGISREDVYVMTNAKWGQGLIESAISNNQAARENAEKLMGEPGGFQRHGFMERVTQSIKDKPWLLALLLLGPVAPIAIGLRAATMKPAEEEVGTVAT